MVDFVEIYKVCARKAIIEAAKRIINSDTVCHSYSDLNFGVTFLEHGVVAFRPNRFFCCRFIVLSCTVIKHVILLEAIIIGLGSWFDTSLRTAA